MRTAGGDEALIRLAAGRNFLQEHMVKSPESPAGMETRLESSFKRLYSL